MSSDDTTTTTTTTAIPKQEHFPEDDRPIASFFTSIYDIHFEAPLKSVADTLYGISEASEFFFLINDEKETQENDKKKNSNNSKKHKLKIVPAKLQTFKEKAFQSAAKKFGFVEFHIRSDEKVQNFEEIISSFHSEENKQKNLDLVHSQIDTVFGALSGAQNLGLKLKRVPDLAMQHLQQAAIVSEAKDPLKTLCFLSMRLEFAPDSNGTTTEDATAAKNDEKKVSDRDVFYFINNPPVCDMMLMREEHPEKFPSPATSDSVEKFFLDMLGGSDEKKFVLAKKEETK